MDQITLKITGTELNIQSLNTISKKMKESIKNLLPLTDNQTATINVVIKTRK